MPFSWDDPCLARGWTKQSLTTSEAFAGDGRSHLREYPNTLETYRYTLELTVTTAAKMSELMTEFLNVGLTRSVDWTPPDAASAGRFTISAFSYRVIALEFWRISISFDSAPAT